MRKEYGAKVAVESLTLTVRQGEVFGFLGPNGAGKSTTIKMLMGLVFPTSGAMALLGRPIGNVAVKKRVGFLPEQFRFHEWMLAAEFLDFHGQLYGMAAAERRRRIPEVLELVGLEGEGRNRLKTFSKGMLQRIGLAQAVMNNPALVFLDEPTSALDPVGRREVRDVIGRFKSEGMTVFLNSHILTEVEQVCDRCAIINHGRVARMGTMRELLAEELTVDITLDGVGPEVWNALDSGVELIGIDNRTLTIRTPDEERIPLLVDRLVAAGARIYAVTPHRRTLEDVFMEAIGMAGSTGARAGTRRARDGRAGIMATASRALAPTHSFDPIASMKRTWLLSRMTFREAVRKKMIWAVFLLTALFVAFYGWGVYRFKETWDARQAARSFRFPITFNQAVDLNMAFAVFIIFFLAAVMGIFAAIGTIAGEVDMGTFQAILPKPIRRWEVVLGKWLGYAIMLALYVAIVTAAVATEVRRDHRACPDGRVAGGARRDCRDLVAARPHRAR